MKKQATFIALTLCVAGAIVGTTLLQAESKTNSALPSKADIEALGATWGKALSSGVASNVYSLYDSDAVLLATFSDELDAPAEIQSYFEGLVKKPSLAVKFDKQNIKVLDEDSAVNSGLYTFSFNDESGNKVEVPARYTFVYSKNADGWKIDEHHSSVRPEKK